MRNFDDHQYILLKLVKTPYRVCTKEINEPSVTKFMTQTEAHLFQQESTEFVMQPIGDLVCQFVEHLFDTVNNMRRHGAPHIDIEFVQSFNNATRRRTITVALHSNTELNMWQTRSLQLECLCEDSVKYMENMDHTHYCRCEFWNMLKWIRYCIDRSENFFHLTADQRTQIVSVVLRYQTALMLSKQVA